MKHKHYDLILQWIKDTTQIVEVLNDFGLWVEIHNPLWFTESEYRFKPKFIKVNGFVIPEPVREPLALGQDYWLAATDLGWPEEATWDNCEIDFRRLHLGIVHLVESKAQAHIDAMLAPSRSDK